MKGSGSEFGSDLFISGACNMLYNTHGIQYCPLAIVPEVNIVESKTEIC